MNYLAHIQLAHVTQTSKVGNLLGDFVKGSDLSHLPAELQQGIRLHRSIDSFTDMHPAVIELRENFPSSIRRMSGVIIDLYFDHVLCLCWDEFNTQNIATVLDAFYDELQCDTHATRLPARFNRVKQGLLEYRWLQNYKYADSCARTFSQIETRLKHKVTFAQAAGDFWQKNQDEFVHAFHLLYPDLIKHSNKFLILSK